MIIDLFPASTRSSKQRRELCENDRLLSKVTDNYKSYGYDYFDNPGLGVGYGGYLYDGRYAETVERICNHYELKEGDRVLEIGCAKGFILVEFYKRGISVAGIDASEYAVENAHHDIKQFINVGNAAKLDFKDNEFDFVLGKEVLPHIPKKDIRNVIKEAMRVSSGKIFFEIQVGESQKELEYMKKWDVTHQVIKPSSWWEAVFEELSYKGDRHYKVLIKED